MNRESSRWLGRLVYVGLTVAVLIVSLMNLGDEAGEGTGTFLAYTMLILTFPLGLVAYAILAVALYLIYSNTGAWLPFGTAYVLLFWSLLFVTGYLQWFVVLPLVKKWRSRSKSTGST